MRPAPEWVPVIPEGRGTGEQELSAGRIAVYGAPYRIPRLRYALPFIDEDRRLSPEERCGTRLSDLPLRRVVQEEGGLGATP